jgi:hypothetical protein
MTGKILPLIALLALASSGALAQELVVTATGVITNDSDASNTFGFGVSNSSTYLYGASVTPCPGSSPCVDTAAGQLVTMTFTLNLSQTPTDACANNACPGFTAATRYAPFANTVPAANWITATDSIGGIAVPEFAPNGGNVGAYAPNGGSTGTFPFPAGGPGNPYGSSEALVDMSNTSLGRGCTPACLSAPYNEMLIQSTQVVMTTGANGAFAATTETAFLRIDDILATPFLNGLGLDQNFSWSSSMDDGASIAQIERAVTVGSCSGARCAGYQIVNAAANVRLESVTGTFMAAPEIDPTSAASGLALLLGGLIVLRGRRSASSLAI